MTGGLSAGAYVGGLAVFAVEVLCATIAAWLVVNRRWGALNGAAKGVAWGLVTTLGLVAEQLVPLALGVLTRGTVIASSLLLLAASVWFVAPKSGVTNNSASGSVSRHAPPNANASPSRGVPAQVSAALGLAGVVAFAAFCLGSLSQSLTYHVDSVDALSFHLPGVIRYVQSGSLWHIAQYLPQQAQGNYPQSGDMLLLSLVLPWHSLAFVRLLDPLLLALAATALYALAVELGAPQPTAALAALAVCVIRPTLAPALTDVLTDPAFLAGFAAGALFLVRYRRTGAAGDLILAGLGFGLALGTKWYGLTDVPIVLVVWIVCELFGGRDRRAVRNSALALVGITLLAGGVWLLRNWILTGDPVFDYKVAPLGLTIFPAPPNPLRTLEGFSLAHYLPHPTILKTYVWPVFKSDFGLVGLAVVLGAIAALVMHLRGAEDRAERLDAPTILAVSALLCVVAYFLTPYSAQGLRNQPILVVANTRYGAPALLLGAPLLALLAKRLPPMLASLLDAGLLALVVIDLGRYLPVTTARVIIVAAIVLAALGAWRLLPMPYVIRTPQLAALPVALILAGLAALGFHDEKVLTRRPYYPDDPTVDYVLQRVPAGSRIGITGTWLAQGLIPVAPLFGPRLENRLSYVGPWIQHRLEQYTSAAGFDAALGRGRFSYLEVGTGFPPSPRPAQMVWAEQAGYVVVSASPRLILMRHVITRRVSAG